MLRLRSILEGSYGQYPSMETENRAELVAERKATYTAVQRLYGIRTVRSLKDVEEVGVRVLWKRLFALSTDAGYGKSALEKMAKRAFHSPKLAAVEF